MTELKELLFYLAFLEEQGLGWGGSVVGRDWITGFKNVKVIATVLSLLKTI